MSGPWNPRGLDQMRRRGQPWPRCPVSLLSHSFTPSAHLDSVCIALPCKTFDRFSVNSYFFSHVDAKCSCQDAFSGGSRRPSTEPNLPRMVDAPALKPPPVPALLLFAGQCAHVLGSSPSAPSPGTRAQASREADAVTDQVMLHPSLRKKPGQGTSLQLLCVLDILIKSWWWAGEILPGPKRDTHPEVPLTGAGLSPLQGSPAPS